MQRIAIIGAGPGGLGALKNCLEAGLQPICFESQHQLGGLWNYTEKTNLPRACVYEGLHMNTSKYTSVYSDFPADESAPWFCGHATFLEYLRKYSEKFNLVEYIQFGKTVKKVVPVEGYHPVKWEVTYEPADTKQTQKTDVFDGLMVCNGLYSEPFTADIPGLRDFEGLVIHSQNYRVPDPFKNKTILVIGASFSGVDVAADLTRVNNKVLLSRGDGTYFARRVLPFGLPWDIFLNSFTFIPDKVKEIALKWILHLMVVDQNAIGIVPTIRGFADEYANLTDSIVTCLTTGRVTLRPKVSHFDAKGVVYVDGSRDDIDVVVMATGFKTTMPFLPDNLFPRGKDKKFLCYKHTFLTDPKYKSLGIIGYIKPFFGFIGCAEMQSRWFIQVFKGHCNLPSRESMADYVRKWHADQIIPRNKDFYLPPTMTVKFMNEIGKEFGVCPKPLKYLMNDPKLAWCILFGPCIPAWYRLEGPGSWPGAKDVIKKTMPDLWKPLSTGVKPCEPTYVRFLKLIGFILVGFWVTLLGVFALWWF